MSRKKKVEDEPSVFDFFGATDPKLKDSLRQLADAVVDLPNGSQDFKYEPNLTMVVTALQDVLDAAGHREASLAMSRWLDYEMSGRLKSKRNEAWLRCDALFKLDIAAATDGWVSDPSRPRPHTPETKPLFPPKE